MKEDKKEYVLGVDYTIEDGRVVFSADYLIKKGKCCGNNCDNCPYTVSIKGNDVLRDQYK